MNTKWFKENFGWVKDIAIVIGIVGMLFLNQNFVTHAKFDNYATVNDQRFESIQKTINSLDKSLALLQQNNVILTSLQSDFVRVNAVLNDVVTQNKVDDAVNQEFRAVSPKISQLNSAMDHLQKLQLDTFIRDDSVRDAEIELKIQNLQKAVDEVRAIIKTIKPQQ